MKILVIITILTLVMSSLIMSLFFGFITNYKPELWALIILILYEIMTKKDNIIKINLPENINSGYKNSISVKNNELQEVSVDKSKISAWKDVKVGESFLQGENYKSDKNKNV